MMLACLVMSHVWAAGGKESKSDSPEKVKFSFWYTAAEGDDKDVVYRFNKQNVELFMERNPNVEIETFILGGDGAVNYKTKLITEAAAGNLPDVFMTWHGSVTQPMVDADLLMPLDDVVKSDAELSKIIDYSKLSLCMYDGKLYGLVDTVDAIGFFYNKALFKQYGLEVPKTYEELLAVGKVFQDKGIIPMVLGVSPTNWMASLIWQFFFMQEQGVDRYTKDIVNGAYDLTDSAYIKAARQAQELAKLGFYGKNFNSIGAGEAKTLFTQGKSAMLLFGTWGTASIAASLGDDLGYMTLPSVNGKESAYMVAASKGWAVSKNAPKEALDFLKFIYSKERQAAYAEMGVFISTKNVPYDTTKLPPIMNDISSQLNASNYTFVIWGDFFSQSVITDLWPAMQSVLSGQDPEKLFKAVMDIKNLDR